MSGALTPSAQAMVALRQVDDAWIAGRITLERYKTLAWRIKLRCRAQWRRAERHRRSAQARAKLRVARNG